MTDRIVPSVAAATLGILVLWWTLFGTASFFSEAGPFETWSAGVHLAAAFLALLWRAPVFVPVGFWLLSDRETPFDLPILTEQVLDPAFYAAAPLHEALIGAAFALLVLISLAQAIVVGAPALWRAAREGRLWALLVAAAGACALAAQAAEGIGGETGIALAIEETLETLFGFLLISALALWRGAVPARVPA